MTGRGLGTLLLGLAAMATPAAAQSELAVAHRVALPLPGGRVDLTRFVPPGEEPVRIRVSGTLTDARDGYEVDALGLRLRGEAQDADPLVALPAGAALIEADREAHRYLFEVPRGRPLIVGLSPRSLSRRTLRTPAELARDVTGALEVEVLWPGGAAVADSAPVARAAGAAPVGWGPGLGALGGLGLLALGLGAARRHRDRSRRLVRRARRARRAIAREARALGPAFVDAVLAAEALEETARELSAHGRATRRAYRRTRRLGAPEAVARRASLRSAEAATLARLEAVTEMLETTAAELARCSVETPPPVARVTAALKSELDHALAATREARALG